MEEEIQIKGAQSLRDDFYKKNEAPKFVDLIAPNRHRSSTENRYWFCLCVGYDHKHEEEMDSEAIYKNFVLRVMAARSPNALVDSMSALCYRMEFTIVCDSCRLDNTRRKLRGFKNLRQKLRHYQLIVKPY